MSEPLSSVEIEDVLSSIRRLVSEDLRPASRGPALRRAEPDKLILTPALRVVASAPAATEAAIAWVDEIAADDGAPMVEMTDWPPLDWRAAEVEISALREAEAGSGWAQDDAGEAAAVVVADTTPDAALDVAWVDQAEAEVIATLAEPEVVTEFASEVGPESEAAPTTPELQFDEAVLRDLVRDLIREELQGGLGERITRNVRKLVRQEIARALAARDLE